jgi:hypothetical protein
MRIGHLGKNHLNHIVLRKNKDVVGLAQVATITPPLLRSGTAIIFWGPLWRKYGEQRDVKILSCFLELLRAEYVERRGLFLRVIPNEMIKLDEVRQVLERAGFHFKGGFYKTYLLDITPSLDSLRKRLRQKWRNHLNRAENENLTVIKDTGLEAYDTFYALFCEMKERKQFSDISFDPRKLRVVHKYLPLDLKPRIFLCKKGHNPLAGAVISAIGNTGILLLAATTVEGRKVMASYILQWRLIEWLQTKGIHYYDLGGTSPSHPSVNYFKAGLGGEAAIHAGLFEQCSNPASLVFDRTLGIMKNCRTRASRIASTLRSSLGH